MTSTERQNLFHSGKDLKLPQIPAKLLPQLIHTLQAFPNDTTDFSVPHIRNSLHGIYSTVVAAYVTVVLMGIALNFAMLWRTLKISNVLRDINGFVTEYLFLFNVALFNLIICLLVVPLSLAIMLIQNWIFGKFFCYMTPILQDVPLYGGLLSLVGNAYSRYKFINKYFSETDEKQDSVHWRDLKNSSSPTGRLKKLAVMAVPWITVIAAVLPQSAYVQFYDLQATLGVQFKGVGLCTVDSSSGIILYNRAVLVGMYIIPLVLCGVIIASTSTQLLRQGAGTATATGGSQHLPNSSSTSTNVSRVQHDDVALSSSGVATSKQPELPVSLDKPLSSGSISRLLTHLETESKPSYGTPVLKFIVDVMECKIMQWRTQKYQIAITLCYGICLCPLMILRLLKSLQYEGVVEGHLDILFLCSVWIAVFQTITTPILFLFCHRLISLQDTEREYVRSSQRLDSDAQFAQHNPAASSFQSHHTQHPGYRTDASYSLSLSQSHRRCSYTTAKQSEMQHLQTHGSISPAHRDIYDCLSHCPARMSPSSLVRVQDTVVLHQVQDSDDRSASYDEVVYRSRAHSNPSRGFTKETHQECSVQPLHQIAHSSRRSSNSFNSRGEVIEQSPLRLLRSDQVEKLKPAPKNPFQHSQIQLQSKQKHLPSSNTVSSNE